MAKKKSKASTSAPAANDLIPKAKNSKLKDPEPKAPTDPPAANQLVQPEFTNPVVACAENVAVLDLLSRSLPTTETPSPVWVPRSEAQDEPTRQLSYEQEDGLVKELAFLSGISDDPNHIMAVCVQEFPEQRRCDIILAVNKHSAGCAQDVLEKARRGLQRIFEKLREVSPSESTQSDFAVLAKKSAKEGTESTRECTLLLSDGA